MPAKPTLGLIILPCLVKFQAAASMRRESPHTFENKSAYCPFGEDGPFCTDPFYFKEFPPNFATGSNMTVNVTMNLKALMEVDSFDEDFTILVHVAFAWNDQRIKWNQEKMNSLKKKEINLGILLMK